MQNAGAYRKCTLILSVSTRVIIIITIITIIMTAILFLPSPITQVYKALSASQNPPPATSPPSLFSESICFLFVQAHSGLQALALIVPDALMLSFYRAGLFHDSSLSFQSTLIPHLSLLGPYI